MSLSRATRCGGGEGNECGENEVDVENHPVGSPEDWLIVE